MPLLLNKKAQRDFSVGKTRFKYHDFGFELAFAVTFHKIQGQTLDKIVLDLNGTGPPPMTLAALYVGISRVRRAADMRVLAIEPEVRNRLLKLTFTPMLLMWWNAQRS